MSLSHQYMDQAHWIPTERLAPVIQGWLDDHKAKHNSTQRGKTVGNAHGVHKTINGSGSAGSSGPHATLEFMSGVSSRRISGICRCEYKNTSLTVADKLLTAMGLVHLFYLPADQGGFADRYFHPSVINAPEALAA